MLTKNEIQEIIFHSLSLLNDEKSSEDRIMIDVDTQLFGTDAVLDSLSLVSVIVDVEEAVSRAVGIEISLSDDRAMEQKVSPFTNVTTLTDYVLTLLAEI